MNDQHDVRAKSREAYLVHVAALVPEMYKALKAVQSAWSGDIVGYAETIKKVDEIVRKIENPS